jgi:hypothetical protein
MEIIKTKTHTLKQIFKDNFQLFIQKYPHLVTWRSAFNIWKIMNCREPDGLGYATFVCPKHPSQLRIIPHSCKSRFCSVCAKTQNDKYFTKINDLFPNSSYFHITFTIPSQFRNILFEKKCLLSTIFKASADTLLSFSAENGFIPAITCVSHTFGSDLKRHVHIHAIMSAGGLALTGKQIRYTRFKIKKKKNGQINKKKITVIKNQPKWISCEFIPYKMIQKRFQALLIEYLKRAVLSNIDSDPDLKPFSDEKTLYHFFDSLKKEYDK